MKIIDCIQKSPEWYAARIGIPTASAFEKILSPTGKVSTQWEAYAHSILAEEIVGHAIEGYVSKDMEEGIAREEESRAYYEMERSVDVVKVGFCTDDARTMGYSPDGFVGDDGLLEFKNPKHTTQVGYYLGDDALSGEYWPQLQGGLLVTERKWVDIVSYFPEMPPHILRVDRDEAYIAKLADGIAEFNAKLAAKRQRLIGLGIIQTGLTGKEQARLLGAG